MDPPAGAQRLTAAMSPPRFLEGDAPTYTKKAYDAGVEGKICAQCVITTEGAVTQCRIINSLAPMDDAILAALPGWRYRPALLDGKPVAVDYPISITLVHPEHRKGVIHFSSEMTRPMPISPPAPKYTHAARVARVQGLVTVKCVLTTEGRATNCQILKGLPHMDQAILDAFAKARFTPATFKGKRVTVYYVFNFKLRLESPSP